MAAVLGRAPEPFRGESNEFQDWFSEFETYLSVVEITQKLTDEQKLSILKNCIGPSTCIIIAGFPNKSSYAKVTNSLNTHFVPKRNRTYDRHVFSRRMQKSGESVSSFLNALQTLSKECEFESDKPDTVVNQRIRDQFILGTSNEDIRKRLLA